MPTELTVHDIDNLIGLLEKLKQAKHTSDCNRIDVEGITITEAHALTGAYKGTISRAVKEGEIGSNKKTGRSLRIDGNEVARWILKRKQRREKSESATEVESKFKKSKGK